MKSGGFRAATIYKNIGDKHKIVNPEYDEEDMSFYNDPDKTDYINYRSCSNVCLYCSRGRTCRDMLAAMNGNNLTLQGHWTVCEREDK